MIAPRTGPHIRSHAIGGPAWRSCRSPESESHRGPAGRRRASAGRPAAARPRWRWPPRPLRPIGSSGSSSRRASSSPRSRSPSAGGRQSRLATVAPLAASGSANMSSPTFTARTPVGEEHGRSAPRSSSRLRPRPVARAATIRAASQAARALLGARMTPACGQASLLAGEALRVAIRAAHRGDDGKLAPCRGGSSHGHPRSPGRARRPGPGCEP